MATKKIKRFREGGVSDKDSGLEASKDDKVGFFERLRMGNIDDEGSEAYRRFGAGRGKAERTPVEDRVATPTAQQGAKVTSRPVAPSPAQSRPTRPDQQASGQSFGQAFAAARKAGDKTFTFKGKSFTTETKEDVAKRKTAAAKKRDDADFAAESARDKTTRSVAGSPNTTQNRAATQKDADTSAAKRSIKDDVDRATKAAKQAAIQKDADTSATKRSIKDAVNRATQKNEGNNAPRRKLEPLSSVRRPGTNINYENTDSYDMSMKRGGKVTSAARRADGIAVRGKTRA